MGNPYIIDKVMVTLTIMLFVLIVADIFSSVKQIDRCEENNAVVVKSIGKYVCIKNTAITEVN
jgi:hypothetical protein